jgi:flagellar motor component MotA
MNSSVIAFIMAQSSLELTHSPSSSLVGGGGLCFGGMVNRKQRTTQDGYRLVKQNARAKVETHTLSSVLPRTYECSTYTAGGNR